jgi:hypothetical protein
VGKESIAKNTLLSDVERDCRIRGWFLQMARLRSSIPVSKLGEHYGRRDFVSTQATVRSPRSFAGSYSIAFVSNS